MTDISPVSSLISSRTFSGRVALYHGMSSSVLYGVNCYLASKPPVC